MSKEIDLEHECGYIMDAINKYKRIHEGYRSININEFCKLYEMIEDGLISANLLIEKGPSGFVEYTQKLRLNLESNLFYTILVLIARGKSDYHEKFIKSVWGKKMRDLNYFDGATQDENFKRMHKIIYG